MTRDRQEQGDASFASVAGPERDLVRRCLRGDESAWADLYRQHAPAVSRFLGRLIGGDDGRDDLVQEVFVAVLGSLKRFEGEARLSTWILGVTANVAMHHRRSEARRHRRLVLTGDPEDGTIAADGPSGPSDAVAGAEARAELRIVQAALGGLSVEHRAAWILTEVEGLDSCEVAAALGIPVGTVRSRLFHVRRRLLEALEAAGFARPARGETGIEEGGTLRLVRSL